MNRYWVLDQKRNAAATVEAVSPEDAIRNTYGSEVIPAGPFEFDFCIQEFDADSRAYRYYRHAREGGARRSGA